MYPPFMQAAMIVLVLAFLPTRNQFLLPVPLAVLRKKVTVATSRALKQQVVPAKVQVAIALNFRHPIRKHGQRHIMTAKYDM